MNEIEKKRAQLERLWDIEEELSNITLEAKQVIADVRGIKAMEYSDMPSGHKITDLSDKIVMLEERLRELKDGKSKLIDEKYRIFNAIKGINNSRYKSLLILKYVEHKSNDQISEEKGYSNPSIKRDIRKAIEIIRI